MTHGYDGLCWNEEDAKKNGRVAYQKNFDLDQKKMEEKIKAIKEKVKASILYIFEEEKKA